MPPEEHSGPHVTVGPGEAGTGITESFDAREASGTLIGRYHLLQKIGEGGMGEVWLAEQREPVRRRVALKLVKGGMNTREVIARFGSERQALALMEHSAIAKVFDAGSTPEGAPYFVMEYVAGVPITHYCDSHRLNTRERLELFIHVCEGVQHAHQKAIIHRDLKPSNILVTEVDGRAMPKIIDFGVAKALTQKLTADTMFTRVGALVGTPEYMSPEQANSSGEDIDTRTDVYSLGVILYELLAGVPPLDLRKVAFEEFLRRLREEEPPKPSTKIRTQDSATSTDLGRKRQTEPLALSRQIRGDLDSIALKALEKDRSRRYSSPSDLAADIGRHLKNEAVLAVPASAPYRAWKFVKRNRLMVGAGLALAASLIGGITVSTIQARRAQRRFAQVRELANTFLFQFYDQVTPLAGSTAVRASIVETARKYLDGLAREAGNDKDLLFELAQAYQRLGVVQGSQSSASLGQVEDARRSYQRSLELYERLPVNSASPSDRRRQAARMLIDWAQMENAQSHSNVAEGLIRRAMPLLEGGRQDPQTRLVLVLAERRLAAIRNNRGAPVEALALLESAMKTLLDLRASGESGPEAIVAIRAELARARVGAGDLDGALGEFQEVLRSTDPCDEKASPAACRALATRLGWTADVYGALDVPNLGQPDKAAPLYRQAIAILERLAAQDPQNRQARFDLAARYGRLADVLWRADPERALELYRRALTTAKSLVSKEQAGIIREAYLTAITRPLIQLGRTAEARQALTEALKPTSASEPEEYEQQVWDIEGRTIWAPLLMAEGKREEAQRTLDELVRSGEALVSSHPNDLTAVFALSNCYRELGAITAGEQRRHAFLRSAAAWHSWPATSFTRREEQRDLASATR